jgi:DNA adenine methylase
MKNQQLLPAIKWSGSKRSQALEVLKHFPLNIDTYYEPFCGGCSILGALLLSQIKVKNYVCSDLNSDLIALWNLIKENPDKIINYYSNIWEKIISTDNIDEKREIFNTVRKNLNEHHNPLDFMFIMRTCANGMPRYNSKGEFNTSFHITRNGINPETLNNILHKWNDLLNKKNVQFKCCSYEKINPTKNDFIYLDPPYAKTKGMYFGNLDNNLLWKYIRNLKCGYALSFDGISGKENHTSNVPVDMYDEHLYLKSGNSSFKRIIGTDKSAIVYESLYIKK